jgi:hypothetical protein
MKSYKASEIHAIVSESPYTFIEFSKHIASMLDIEWDDRFKNRVTQCLSPSGTSKLTKQEQQAMDTWCHCYRNIGELCLMYRDRQLLKAKTSILIDWLSGKRQINWRESRVMQKFLKQLNHSS